MSQRGKKSPQWSGAELKVLADIKRSGATLKDCMHLLPGRTFFGAKTQLARLPGGKKKRGRTGWVSQAMTRILCETPNLTNRQLAEAIGCTRNAINGVLNSELGVNFHVSAWTRAGTLWAAQYSHGNLPNVLKPAPRTREESYRAQKIARQAIRRARNPFAVAIRQIADIQVQL